MRLIPIAVVTCLGCIHVLTPPDEPVPIARATPESGETVRMTYGSAESQGKEAEGESPRKTDAGDRSKTDVKNKASGEKDRTHAAEAYSTLSPEFVTKYPVYGWDDCKDWESKDFGWSAAAKATAFLSGTAGISAALPTDSSKYVLGGVSVALGLASVLANYFSDSYAQRMTTYCKPDARLKPATPPR